MPESEKRIFLSRLLARLVGHKLVVRGITGSARGIVANCGCKLSKLRRVPAQNQPNNSGDDLRAVLSARRPF